MGDFVGHPFRGNQWTDGSSVHEGKGSSPRFADDDWAQRGTPPGHTARIDPATGRVVIEKNAPTSTKDGSAPHTDDNPTGEFKTDHLAKYEKVIRKQDYESAAVVDVYGRPIFSKDGEKDAVNFTIEECAKMRGMVLTHNHPSNSSFSDQDVHLFFARGLREIRVVGRGGSTYRLGADPSVMYPANGAVATMVFTAFRTKLAAVRAKTWNRITSGEITAKQADDGASEEMHQVLMQLAEEFKDNGLYYKRRK